MKRLTVLFLLLLVAPAQAGTVEVRTHLDHGVEVRTYVFTAAPGEVNQVTVEPVGEGFRLVDAGAPVTGACPEGLCPEAYRLVVDLSDGDDTAIDRGGRIGEVSGGHGNDRLESDGGRMNGGEGDDTLIGGPGNNLLDGGPGQDALYGGPSNDGLLADGEGAAPVADLIDGGGGQDTATYTQRATPVRIELARDLGPEGDTLTSIEHATGGRADDVLIGDDAANNLDGAGGDDRIEGRGGDDYLEEDSGRDDVRGGAGDDRLELVGAHEVRCGSGLDRVNAIGGVVRLHADCERARGGGPVLRLTGGTVTPRWDARRYPHGCRLRITLGGTPITAGRPTRVRHPATLRFTLARGCRDVSGEPMHGQSFRLVR
ncbi:hypothetical protein OJ997_25980 [Solirubrobacter phytolaccae]|uniref:Calcium-binding protein n=1 Tax=Solirubrobacter phytolaccae TaxID=1404360 RepID=A0A9X3SAK4_9ACTN|nr:calcium-binding protein [Solirubrobacter phytolaccae]MDA0183783.1 hypothetical protein [Solirubrobacter phytolaccae]